VEEESEAISDVISERGDCPQAAIFSEYIDFDH
jgi:hypothetical protein